MANPAPHGPASGATPHGDAREGRCNGASIAADLGRLTSCTTARIFIGEAARSMARCALHRNARPRHDPVDGSGPQRGAAASANDAMSGNVASGAAKAGGVAPLPSLPWRRLIHTVESPSCFAGTWSWNRD